MSYCENYARLYSNAKHFEKRLNRRGMKFLEPFFHKKVPFQVNTECCPKFLEYALYSILITTEGHLWLPWSFWWSVHLLLFKYYVYVSKSSKAVSFEALLKSIMKVHKLEKILSQSDERKKLFTEKWKTILQNLQNFKKIWGVIPLNQLYYR